ncbi:hypothetical protein [Luteibacter jiangsuensis]
MRIPSLSSLLATATFALSLALAFGSVSPVSASPVQTASESARVIGAEEDLRHLLGNRYAAFERNFTETANPVLLKDGGLFIDGWRSGAPFAHAAAFIHYPDGRTFAAWFDEETGHITYVGDGPVHPAIVVWARRFGPTIEVLPASTQTRTHLQAPDVVTLADSPTAEDQVELRKVAASIWGQSLASSWDMNAEVGDILGTVTHEIMECSAAFSLVPKPVGWVPGWSYIAKSALSVVAYITGVSSDRVYKTCVTAAALNWRSAIELASAGI